MEEFKRVKKFRKIAGQPFYEEFYGIADCHGIESFLKDKKLLGVLHIRAHANRHRHALVYRCKILKEDSDRIKALLREQKYKLALLHLKETAIEIGVDMLKSWNMIPDSRLDPFHHGDEE